MILTAKACLALVCFLCALPLSLWAPRPTLAPRQFSKAIVAAVAVSRLGLFTLIFLILGISPQSDVTAYWSEGHAVLKGESPLLDIPTAYGPLFDCLVATIIPLWDSPAALVLFAILLEIISVPVWMAIGRRVFDEAVTRRAAVLYVVNPLPISVVAIAGQNHVGLSLLLALSLLALARRQDVLSAAWLGFSIIAVKFLSLLFMPPLFLAAHRRVAWVAAFAVFPVLGYGAVAALGAHPWQQVAFHGSDNSSGNLPYLLGAAGLDLADPHRRVIADIAAFSVLCASFLAVIWRCGGTRPSQPVLMCAFVLLVTMILSKKAYASYLVIVLFPLCIAVAGQAKFVLAAICLELVMGLATLEPSLWFRWMGQRELGDLLKAGVVTPMHTVLFLSCDVLLVAGYAAMIGMVWSAMAKERHHRDGAVWAAQG